MERIENRTFDELAVGESATLVRTLTRKDIEVFAIMSGDVNPAHVDEEFARGDMFQKVVAHGMWGGALISTVLGTKLPGPGTIYVDQSLRFIRPVGIGDTISVTVTVKEKNPRKRRVILECRATNQHGKEVISGTAEVIAPDKKISRERVSLPDIELRNRESRYERLVQLAAAHPPVPTAVVHSVDPAALLGAADAARAGLIVPVLVGPERDIRAAADQARVDIRSFEIRAVDDARGAAEEAVALARSGKVGIVMKGALRSEELIHAGLDPHRGLLAGRRVSHVFAVDAQTYPRLLFVTDAAINIEPTLAEKRDIVQNAIDLAQALGIAQPRVAILSAVENVTERIRSTLDAAALCKMAERGQITGATVDGPLAFDTAVSPDSAIAVGIASPVAGCADILVVPDLEAGSILAKQLVYLAGAKVAGIVLGARVPIILTTRDDSASAQLASCAMAVLMCHRVAVPARS